MKRKLQRIGAVLAFALMALVAWSWWGPGPLKQKTVVVIPEGAALDAIRSQVYGVQPRGTIIRVNYGSGHYQLWVITIPLATNRGLQEASSCKS